jgi:hypothetical protein
MATTRTNLDTARLNEGLRLKSSIGRFFTSARYSNGFPKYSDFLRILRIPDLPDSRDAV